MTALWQQFRTGHVSLVFGAEVCWVTADGEKILQVPNRVLLSGERRKVVAIGEDARPVEYAATGKAELVVPITRAGVADDVVAVPFVQALLRTALGRNFFLKPQVRISVPERTSPFGRELWEYVALAAGARSVILASPLLAVATGVGLVDHPGQAYAVVSWDADGATFGLVVMERVQFRHDVVWGEVETAAQLEWLRDGWQRFLASLPSEFAASVQREGAVVVSEHDEVAWQKRLNDLWSVPVVMVSREREVSGLHALAREGV